MTITVHGTPAPQGSKSFKGMRGGHAILTESSKAVKPWREAVKHAALGIMGPASMPVPVFPGAVDVSIRFVFPRPKAAKNRAHMAVKPDIDKLQRSTFDALKDAGVFEDDSRVVSVRATKGYSLPELLAGAIITIEEAGIGA